MDFTNLNEADLENDCPYISIVRVQKMDVDVVGRELSRSLQGFGIQNSLKKKPPSMAFLALPRDFWAEVKKEFYLFLCTKDRKYAKLRSQLNKQSNAATTTIVSMISVAIATELGAAIGIITPLVALLLFAILKLSVNSWCNLQTPVKGKSPPPAP